MTSTARKARKAMGAFDLRVRPRGCRDPLTNKQITVRYDSHRKLISRCPSECFEGFFPRRGAAVMVLSSLQVLGFRSVSLVPQSSIPEFNVSFGSAAPLLQILGILRHDVHVHRRRLPQEPMHCRQVGICASPGSAHARNTLRK